MTDLQQTYYRQVKNPNPVFTPRKGAGTLKFCEKLMEKAVGFTSRFDFAIHVAHARSRGLRRRMPPVLRRRAIDALLQGLCFHYDPLANRVQCSITTLAIECGLATESGAGKLSITRATRALTFLSELGLITYQTEYDPLIGCYIPTDITFTPPQNNPACAGGIRTSEARQYRKKQHHIQKTTSSSTFRCIRFSLFLIQNTPHRRGILLIHIKLQGTSP